MCCHLTQTPKKALMNKIGLYKPAIRSFGTKYKLAPREGCYGYCRKRQFLKIPVGKCLMNAF